MGTSESTQKPVTVLLEHFRRFTALGSERGALMPALDAALEHYADRHRRPVLTLPPVWLGRTARK